MIAVKTERWTTNSLGTKGLQVAPPFESTCPVNAPTLTPVWKTGGSQFSGDEPRDLEMERSLFLWVHLNPTKPADPRGLIHVFLLARGSNLSCLGLLPPTTSLPAAGS